MNSNRTGQQVLNRLPEDRDVEIEHSRVRSTRQYVAQSLADYGLVAIGVAIFATGLVAVSGFATENNFATIMRSASCIGVVAIGMTFVVISGNYADLSVAAQVGIAAVATIGLQEHGLFVAILIGLLGCLAVGLANGVLVGFGGANAVVVTLGTGTLTLGLLNQITEGALFTGSMPKFARSMSTTLGPFPVLFFYFVAIALGAYLLLNRSSYGARLRSLGSNASAARISGVRNGPMVVSAFLICSGCCALAGVMLGGFSNSANPGIASTFVFDALAGIIIGGNSLTGGRGGSGKTVLGVLIIAVVGNLLVIRGLSYEWKQLVTGLIIVVAVGVSAGFARAGLK